MYVMPAYLYFELAARVRFAQRVMYAMQLMMYVIQVILPMKKCVALSVKNNL